MVTKMAKPSDGTRAEVLAIIPARGGSKSIPRKNVKLLGGVPLLSYSIAAGQQARSVSRVIVSTDDEEIVRVAEFYKAEVPFLRPPELAADTTTDLPVFQHALQWLEKYEDYRPDIVVQLRPTSPFRPPHCVDEAVRLMLENPWADSVRAVVPSEQNPYKMWRIAADGLMQPLLQGDVPEPYNQPRQQLPPTYWQTGHVDAMRTETLLQKHSMTGAHIAPLVLDSAYTVDIDTPLDWERAEWMLARGALNVIRPQEFAPSYQAAESLLAHDTRPWSRNSTQHWTRNWDSLEALQLLSQVRLLVLDFDGVMTDNRVLVRQDGTESVWCNRSDGWGLARLCERGLDILVLSTEINPCVTARVKKLGLDCVQGCAAKLEKLQDLARQRGLTASDIAYVGNDLNDLECMQWVGLPIAVADSDPAVLATARLVTTRPGGQGAVREVADALLSLMNSATNAARLTKVSAKAQH